MRTKLDIVRDIAKIAIDAVCVICGAYMMCEFYHDVEDFEKRG